MKFFITIIGILFCFATIETKAQKQNFDYLALYDVVWQSDSLKDNKIKLENYRLLIGENSSLYISESRFIIDSLIINDSRGAITNMNSLPPVSSNARIFRTKDVFTVYDNISSTMLSYDDVVDIKWTLLPDTLTIKGYKCNLAKTFFRGRNYTAWYAYEIPFSCGPYRFSGLPGLIVDIKDDKNVIEFSLVSFSKKKNLHYDMALINESPKKTTRQKFNKMLEDYRKNPIPLMESEGAVFTDETKRVIQEKFKMRKNNSNNKIELTE